MAQEPKLSFVSGLRRKNKEKELVEIALNSISSFEQYTKEPRSMNLLIREIEEKYYTKEQA